MHIDLLPIKGRYRGVSRCLSMNGIRHLSPRSKLYKAYDRYLSWTAKQNDIYDESSLQMLIELRNQMKNHGFSCEVICFSDSPKEFPPKEKILGFDVFGNCRASAIEEGSIIEDYYSAKLNENGLFSNVEDAKEFCAMWNRLILIGASPWEVEENPRPFCVWEYTGDAVLID